jgi:outer membrane lipoprotein-sorting protein
MSLYFHRFRLILALAAVLPATGCLFRSRVVERTVGVAPVRSATQAELVDYVNNQAARVQSMQATVDIDASAGGAKKGKVTDYQEIRGYVLVRKPAMLRMIGLMPVVRNRAFDMVSNGETFKLWVPPKNRFIVGRNDAEGQNTQQPLENLRPQHIYDALLLREIDPQVEIAVLEVSEETITDSKGHKTEHSYYILDVLHLTPPYLGRKIIFSRTDLLPHRQIIYDENGNVATDARYENYKDYEGVNFPAQIEIRRPAEEYDITLNIVKLQLNQPLPDDKFVLEQPAGADVVHLGPTSSAAAPRLSNPSD